MLNTQFEDRLNSFFHGEEEVDRRIRLLLEEVPAGKVQRLALQDEEIDWLKAALATIGTDLPYPELPAHMLPPVGRSVLRQLATIDPKDDPDVIWEQPELTPYERAFVACRQLEAERDALKVKGTLAVQERLRLHQLPGLINTAKKKMKLELERDADPVWQERRRVSEYRKSDEGKAARRNVRDVPNADLTSLSDTEKKEREAEQRYISNLRRRLEKSSLGEIEIAARIEAGLAKRRGKK